MKKRIFLVLRTIYVVLDKIIFNSMGISARQRYVRVCYKLKSFFFKEYGTHIPDLSEIGSVSIASNLLTPSIPSWVIEEMKSIGMTIDPELYPTDEFISTCNYYSYPIIAAPGNIYNEIIKTSCSREDYSHCFAIPWLKRGGADYVSIKHIELAAKQSLSKILVIMTEPGDSPWLSRLPENVDVINFSKIASKISHAEQISVLVRLVIQLKIGVLHIINSRHMWDVLDKHGLALTSSGIKVFVSIYCDDYDSYGRPVGFARKYLPATYKYIERIFTDNIKFKNLIHNNYGYPQELFEVIYSPFDLSVIKQNNHEEQYDKRVIWAGRIDRQKRPDILLSIARLMPDVEFSVYGEAVLDSTTDYLSDMRKLGNITLHGKFNGVESLPLNKHSIFLYTSQWDGIPTILLSVAATGMPIVASDVGGVSEVIDAETRMLVGDFEDPHSYKEAIDWVFNNYSDALKQAAHTRDKVLSNHSDASFASKMNTVPGYF